MIRRGGISAAIAMAAVCGVAMLAESDTRATQKRSELPPGDTSRRARRAAERKAAAEAKRERKAEKRLAELARIPART